MKYKFGKTIVIALGGSVMYPEQIDIHFLKQFKAFILKRVKKGTRFVIVAGGGRIARIYQEAAAKVDGVTDEDKDWLGIHATRANAHLLRTMFRTVADPVVIDARGKIKKLKYPVTIGAGWKPGQSTDHSTITLAADFGIPEAVIAGSPSFVYPVRSRSPQVGRSRPAKGGRAASNGMDDNFDRAHPFRQLTWKEYMRHVPGKWKPGLHSPVDPVAARVAEKNKIKAIIVNGKNLKNFGNLLDGKEFNGTVID